MSASPALHPSVREHREPRVSMTALAQYLILQADGQETILHNSRFSRPSIVTANGDALRALRAYNSDVRRPQASLDTVKEALRRKAFLPSTRPRAKDEALRCVEAIELFERAENALGLRAMSLTQCPMLDELVVEGVALSVRPDFLVHSGDRVGAGLLRVAKAPDPDACKMEETRRRRGDHRREMGRYMVAMMQMLLEAQDGRYGEPDKTLCFVADVRLGERIDAASDHTARLRAIRASCTQIARAWPSITPRKSILRK